jgi:hypothetical protein
MKTIKAYYDGTRLRLISPLPKSISKKKSFVILTFLDDDNDVKVPKGVKNGVMDLINNNTFDLKKALKEI